MAYFDVVRATSGLLAYWPLGETSGTSAFDYKGGYTGTYTGSPTLNSTKMKPGFDMGCPTFVKASSQYVAMGDVSALEANANLSIECWFTLSALPTVGEVLDALYGKLNHYYVTYYNNAGTYMFHTSANHTDTPAQNTVTLTVNQVYHFVLTWNGTTVKHYLDGVQLGSDRTQTSAAPASTATAVEIGRFNGTYYHSGKIAHVAHYNTALSAATVLQHYNQGVSEMAYSNNYQFMSGSGSFSERIK